MELVGWECVGWSVGWSVSSGNVRSGSVWGARGYECER